MKGRCKVCNKKMKLGKITVNGDCNDCSHSGAVELVRQVLNAEVVEQNS